MPENSGKRRLTSTVVVSKAFRREQERRDTEKSKDKRERRYRVRRSSADDEDERRDSRLRGRGRDDEGRGRNRSNKDEIPRNRNEVDDDDEDDARQNRSRRFNERNWQKEKSDNWRDRRNREQVLPASSLQTRRIVVERNMDAMPRGQLRERDGDFRRETRRVVTEVNLNPTDVPRGKRYFMHDDREVPRRQSTFSPRARSRSPQWRHDKFAEVMQDDMNVKGNERKVEKDTEEEGLVEGGRRKDRDIR